MDCARLSTNGTLKKILCASRQLLSIYIFATSVGVYDFSNGACCSNTLGEAVDKRLQPALLSMPGLCTSWHMRHHTCCVEANVTLGQTTWRLLC
eukprot:6210624-Amphidinium_carterae.1